MSGFQVKVMTPVDQGSSPCGENVHFFCAVRASTRESALLCRIRVVQVLIFRRINFFFLLLFKNVLSFSSKRHFFFFAEKQKKERKEEEEKLVLSRYIRHVFHVFWSDMRHAFWTDDDRNRN